MAIVVDVNVFPSVFDSQNEDHAEFLPVKDWIERREGFLVYGGTTFKEELLQSYHRVKLVRLLRDAGRAVEISQATVDALEVEIKEKTAGTDCDDPHVIALLAASRCPLLCSRDKRSFDYVKDKRLYPKACPKVRIYTGIRNIKLLKPCKREQIINVACGPQ